ncbi:MAG: undecaprenyldiphospho-muramoylpentapeptide beta-N-acetylglucosaminyltransferase [Alphaproteobacteria bacterium]|nr:undecaprenyldiphospho-muramoylpentapeptide beta-N-acetylglucosaminyltransferase [Alphaproteobacteria bacterium]
MHSSPPLFLLAAGGTGGHVFPAEALTRELLGRGAAVNFVTDTRGSHFSQDITVPMHHVQASSLGKGVIRKAFSLIIMGVGILQATRLLRKLKPAAVIGFGGYPSVPLLYAASRAGIPIILHEQNAVMGRANRTMMPMAKLLATSFPHVTGVPSNTKAKIVQTGNPVRPTFSSVRATPYPTITDDSPIRILVMGGSLGASIFSSVVPKALALLPAHIKNRILIAQQCRAEDIEDARAAFAGAGILAEVSPFFKDVPDRMAEAHLIIGRSGGGAVAELTAVGRPSILVPFPHGHAGEQRANAEAIAQAGGAWIIPQDTFTPEALAVRLEALITLPSNLAKAATAARAWGTVTAADALADSIYDITGIPTPKSLAGWTANPDVSGQENTLALSTREFYSEHSSNDGDSPT